MAEKRATSRMTLWAVALVTVILGWFSFAQGGAPASQNAAQSNVPVPAGMTRGPNGAPIPSLQPPVPQLPPGMQLPPNAPNPFAPPAGAPIASPKKPLHAGAPIANPVFSQIPNYPAGYAVESIAIGDVNGDGIPDVVVANICQSSSCSNGGVSVLLGNGDGSYQAPVTYSSGGIEAWSVALGDFNGDGKLDIAVANYYADTTHTSSNVSVLLNNGDGTFAAPVSAPVPGFYIPTVAVGDFNGDGKLDLVVSSQCQNNSNCSNGGVSVLLGNGDGTLQPAVSYSSGGLYAYSVLVADFNGDGKPDLAVVNQCATSSCINGGLGVLLNNGDGTFQSPSSLNSGGLYSFAGVVGDFNHDGIADIAITNQCLIGNCANGSVSVFLGNGDGTFSAPVNTQTAQNNSRTIAAGDFNGDGKLDLVIGSTSNNSLQVLLGNGDGSFQAIQYLAGGGQSGQNAFAAADVNGDGKLDILGAVQCPNGNCSVSALIVLLGNGDGTFQTPPTYLSGGDEAFSAATADFNGDGKADLAVINICASNNNCSNGSVGILLGNGNGTLQPVVSYSSGGLDSISLTVGDFNGDGKPDVIVVNECSTGAGCPNGSVSVLLGNGDGTLQAPITSATGGLDSYDLVVGDFNGDGKLDIAVTNHYADTTRTNSSVSVLLGNGDGTFQAPVTYALSGRYAPSIAAGDFNGDGKLDLAVSNECQSSSSCTGVVSILLSNGDGTFQAPQTYSSAGSGTISVAVGDFNGDGKLDLALADSSDISVLLGNGDGTFQTAVSYSTNCCSNGPQSLVVKDFNGDGSLDLASATYSGSVNLLLGNGDGTFQANTPYYEAGYTYGLAAVDLNGDGKPDLALANVTNPSGSVTVLLNIVSGFRNATSTAVISSLNPAGGGQTVTFTATVTPAFGGPPTGTVTFYDGVNVLGTGALTGNQATFSTSALTLGAHSITASYIGDANFLSSTSPVLTETITSSTTTTTLASSLNPSAYGQSVTLTASVTSSGSGTPTGTVTFTDGANTLGTSAVSAGQATLTTSGLGAGAHSITATYSGDSGFTGSTSSPLSQTVNQASTTLGLGSSVNPSAYSQGVTFTATITPQYGGQATGTVTFNDGATVIGSAAVSGNSASFTTNGLALGSHSITASYSGDSNFTASSSGVVAQVVNQATTSTAVVSSLNPAYITQSITFTATVTGQYGGLATGSVTFKAGSTKLGTVTLNGSGQASLTTSFSTAGTRSITAIYAGDVNYQGSTSAVLSQAVNKFPTATLVGSSLSPSLVGQSVTFTATVSSTYGSIPNGDKVTFKDGVTVLATVSLSGGTASYTTSSLAAGTHNITAYYLGDSSFQTSSGTFKQTVNRNPSSSVVASSLNPSTYGQAVTFTATISGGAGTPTGTVTFKNGSAVLGTAALSGGTASLTTSTLSAGTHPIVVVYGGDSTYLGSTSTALSQKVNKASTATSISSSSNPSGSGQSVTFTATVTSSASGVGGTVTFKSGATVLGTGTLNSSGVATFTTSTLPVGSDPISAIYGGNPNFLQSGASMIQVVNP